jgi:hypothetical protein
MLARWTIEARSPYGQALKAVEGDAAAEASQRVVCFTETPLEHLYLLTQPIEGRQLQFSPYGIAFTKRTARDAGVNPVWYLDITPGHEWLTNPLNRMIAVAVAAGDFADSDVAQIAPYIEQMGTGIGPAGPYTKEFWWEREWRHRGDLSLAGRRFIGICPEAEIPAFQTLCDEERQESVWISPSWGLEEIIARLAGFTAAQIRLIT